MATDSLTVLIEDKSSPTDQHDTSFICDNSTLQSTTFLHYQDIPLNTAGFSTTNYVDFTSKKRQSPSIAKSEGNEEQRENFTVTKKTLFPTPLATSFPEVAEQLRNERRQEFAPIYQDETPEQIALRQTKRKPVGSLLAKRIRWDDLKRKREQEQQFYYGPYGPVYNNLDSTSSYANPYDQYYSTMHQQYAQMAEISRAQQEHSGFWPEYQQPSSNYGEQNSGSSFQQTYPTNMSEMPTSNSEWHFYGTLQPPPPPPDEPYPY